MVAIVAVAAATLLGRALGANATTIGLIFLVVVLGLAAWGGWKVGVVASFSATFSFNFFFLPPLHTLNVSEPANWVALGSFLFASTFAARLVATARRQTEDAQERRRETEVLYQLSLDLFAASNRLGAVTEACRRTLTALGATNGTLVLGGEPESLAARIEVGEAPPEVDPKLLVRARHGAAPVAEVDSGGGRRLYLPLEVGGAVRGVLVASETSVSTPLLASAARLLALAIERERLLGEAAHVEALRASETLKTALLRAVSHDLRSPLTALRLEAEGLLLRFEDRPDVAPAERAGVDRMVLEVERLARRIDNLLALARLEAGAARPHPEPVAVGDLVRSARESLSARLAGREVTVRIAAGCPDLWVDPALALEILANLLENADRFSPPGVPVELSAAVLGGGSGGEPPPRVAIEVLDRGPGPSLAAGEGATATGLGLLIVRSLTPLLDGVFSLTHRPGGGAIARVELPAAEFGDLRGGRG